MPKSSTATKRTPRTENDNSQRSENVIVPGLRANEYYPSPSWCVTLILDQVNLKQPVLDAGAGSGNIYYEVIKRYPNVVGVDIDPKFSPCVTSNYLEYGLDYGTTIMNPPFSLWMEFVQHARKNSEHVLALGRLDMLSSVKRHDFMRDTHPNVYVLSRRPSFTGDGATDSRSYAWFEWPGEGRWEVLHG